MYTLYWYPRCSTCKKAKAWLEAHHVDFETHDMIQQPPTAATLTQWLQDSQWPPRRFFNTSGQKYRALGLKEQVPNLSVAQAATLLATDGMLIKRPLLIKDGQVLTIGFKESDYEGAMK